MTKITKKERDDTIHISLDDNELLLEMAPNRTAPVRIWLDVKEALKLQKVLDDVVNELLRINKR